MSKIQFETFQLANGLKVIVHEDHSIPKAVVDIVYRVGARDENPERTGFAHLFEHLMFGGSKNIPDYDIPLQRVGGENNAFTNNDLTNYYLTLPSNQLETGFWLESDRMLELDFSQKSLEIQKKVVIEEFKQRYLNEPYGDAHLILRALHFDVHPYQWPTIGKDISHIEDANLDNVKDFFYGFYAPNNATLVVAGNVKLDEVKALAEKWFGPIPNRTLRKQELPVEPMQLERKEKTVERDVPHASVYKMFHIPAKTDPAYYAAEILTDVLSHGKASRLYQHMVKETKVASGVKAFSWGAHHPGMISIDGQVAKGKTVEQYEAALTEVLEELNEVQEKELSRLKNSIETQFVLYRTSILNRGMGLALSDALGDPDLVNKSLDAYMNLELSDLKTAAGKYFSKKNSSTLYYLPNHAG